MYYRDFRAILLAKIALIVLSSYFIGIFRCIVATVDDGASQDDILLVLLFPPIASTIGWYKIADYILGIISKCL